jgi:hypothetical protein
LTTTNTLRHALLLVGLEDLIRDHHISN